MISLFSVLLTFRVVTGKWATLVLAGAIVVSTVVLTLAVVSEKCDPIIVIFDLVAAVSLVILALQEDMRSSF